MRTIASIAMFLTAIGSLSAQESTGWVDLQGGHISQNADSALKASQALGIGFGGWFNDRWGGEVSLLSAQLESKVTGKKGDETHGMISGLFNFNPGGATLFPFLRLGLGAVAFKGDVKATEGVHRATYHGGLGVQGFFGEHLLGVLEFRETRVGKKTTHRDEAMVLLGIGYRWGGSTRLGQATPAGAEPLPLQRPMVEALPTVPQQPGVEVMPMLPQKPAVEVLPTTP